MTAGQGHDQDPGLDLQKDTRRKRNGTWTLMMSQVNQIVRLVPVYTPFEDGVKVDQGGLLNWVRELKDV